MISDDQIARLVELYSEFHHALDPFAPRVLEAERQFFELLRTLHVTHAPDVPYDEFRRYAVRKCKLYLSKNP
ncbi:MAG: hypothetical protein DME25_11065 [Verrucomicrobia bacterium]|nr:MAG: hypothetical protein DME25_11065 [Verrucomicrobiota bacterium]